DKAPVCGSGVSESILSTCFQARPATLLLEHLPAARLLLGLQGGEGPALRRGPEHLRGAAAHAAQDAAPAPAQPAPADAPLGVAPPPLPSSGATHDFPAGRARPVCGPGRGLAPSRAEPPAASPRVARRRRPGPAQ